MFEQAAEAFRLSLSRSYSVGDRLLDVRSGQAAGCTTVLVRSGHAPEDVDGIVPDHEALTLAEAVEWILQQEQSRIPRHEATVR